MTNYHAHTPDASGFIKYSDDEHAIWHDLFIHQERRHGYFWHACIGLRWNLD